MTHWFPAALVILLGVVCGALADGAAHARRARALRDRLESQRRLPRRRQRHARRGSSPTRTRGAFAALGGLALTAASGLGDPNAGSIYTLNSVAAVVLGGVSLLGGVGGLIGPIAAAFVLTLVKTLMILQGRRPELRAGDPGRADRARRHDRRPRDPAEEARARERRAADPRGAPSLRGALASRQPGRSCSRSSSSGSSSRTDIINRAQGGGAFLTREAGLDDVPLRGGARADRRRADARDADRRRRPLGRDDGDGGRVRGLALRDARRRRRRSRSRSLIGLGIGLVNGIGVAIFRVNALIMTLGISTITLGLLTVQAQKQFTVARAELRRHARVGDGS